MTRLCGCVLCSELNLELVVERMCMAMDWFEIHERIRFRAAFMEMEEREWIMGGYHF